MKIQYSNKPADRIAYMEYLTKTLSSESFSDFIDNPDFHFHPVFGNTETNIIYTNRNFMEKAHILSSEENSILANLYNDFPNATLIVVD